jgi:hypothetical protein
MVAASRQKRETDIRVSTGTRKPAGIFRENMQYQQARGRILAYPPLRRKVMTYRHKT